MRTKREHSGRAVDSCGLAQVPAGHQKAVGAGHVKGKEPDRTKAMPGVEITIRVTRDRTAATIEIALSGQSSQRLVLGIDELDRLISELGTARSKMVEGQPPPDFEELSISTAANTKWYIRAYPPSGALLAFYHPKFGPVGFTLPRDQIAEIVSFLTKRLILQATPSSEKH